MDEDMEDFIEEYFTPSEIDPDYEFDVARFFDFTRPESYYEALEAERWFETARSYPPSPFIVKLNWSKSIPVVEVTSTLNIEAGESMESISNNSDVEIDDVEIDAEVSRSEEKTEGRKYHNHVAQDILKAKMKSMVKSFRPKGSTLMKPTASHLAKQNKARDIYSIRFCRRSQKPLTNVDDKSLQKLPASESEATKRQKLESGYLRKVAHLKHQTLLLHKISKKVGPIGGNSMHSRSKVTIPREPDLETAQRAQRRSFRSKNNSESSQHAKPSAHTFKARPLNRKILEAPSLPLPKKSTPQLPEFQMFHLKTMERAIQHSSANVLHMHNPASVIQSEDTDFKRPNSEDVLKQEKCETSHKFKPSPPNKRILSSKGDTGSFRNIKQEAMAPTEFNFPNDKGLSVNPPIELFNKLSLKSEAETNSIYQSKPSSLKGSKENAHSSFQLEFWRCPRKSNQCGSDMPVQHEQGLKAPSKVEGNHFIPMVL